MLYALYALWSKFHQVMTSHFKAFFAWKDFRHVLCEVSWTQFQTSLCRVYTTMRYHVIMYITVSQCEILFWQLWLLWWGDITKTLAQHGSAQLMTWWTRWDLSLQHPLSHRCRPWCPGDLNSIELYFSYLLYLLIQDSHFMSCHVTIWYTMIDNVKNMGINVYQCVSMCINVWKIAE